MRTFISIDLPNEIIEKIKKIQDALPEFIGKKTEADNLHLTLKFLGEISEEKIELVKGELKKIKIAKFKTEIESIGIFSEKIIRIVWLHLTNCDKLQKEIDKVLQKIGFESERRFMDHLTIARVKNVKSKLEFLEELKKIKIQKMKFVVDNFKLKSSILRKDGPVYEDIEKYNLE